VSSTGGEPVTFQVAGIPVTVSSEDHAWLRLINERYEPFVTGRRPGLSVTWRTQSDTADAVDPPPAAVGEDPRVRPLPDGFEFESRAFSFRVDLDRGAAEIEGPRALYPLDALIRHVLPMLLENGVLLHGGAAVGDGIGTVFCGASGAGKTTLAELLGERALCDEMAGIVLSASGPQLRSTPYWRSRPGEAPLRALFLLRHGDRHRRERLSESDALRGLANHILWPVHLAAPCERCFSVLAEIVARVPVYAFRFTRTADVWEVMTEGFER
jgi:hypothetical protein